MLHAYQSQLPADEAAFLRLRDYRAKNWSALFGSQFDALLRYEMAPRIVAQFCAYLVNNPDPGLLARYYDWFLAAGPPVNVDTVHLYHATYLAAILTGDAGRAEQIAQRIGQFTTTDAQALRGLGEMLKGRTADPRLLRILPLVPLPTEVVYAILDQQSPPVAPAK